MGCASAWATENKWLPNRSQIDRSSTGTYFEIKYFEQINLAQICCAAVAFNTSNCKLTHLKDIAVFLNIVWEALHCTLVVDSGSFMS